MTELHDGDTGSTTTVRAGEEVVIRLPENPTTGYSWEFRQTGPGELAVVDDRFEAGGSPRPGAAGTRVVRLVARRAGNVRVEAVERRPWETGDPQQRREFTVVVE